MSEAGTKNALAAEHEEVFRKSLPMQLTLQELVRAMERLRSDQSCLEIGALNGVFSHQLRRVGGMWETVARDTDLAQEVAQALGHPVQAFKEGRLPFENKSFDLAVAVNTLEEFSDDVSFIEECHRVLKPDGRLVIVVGRVKGYSPITAVRRMAGVTAASRGHVRAGYSESALFRVLKTGFDVLMMRSYRRFFVECVDTLVRGAVSRAPQGGDGVAQRHRIYATAGALYRIADQLDMLLFWTRGHGMLAIGKRRGWRPREAPILSDGRTITEAVLSRPLE